MLRKQFRRLIRIYFLKPFSFFCVYLTKGVCMTVNLIPSLDPLMETDSARDISITPRYVRFGPFHIDRQRQQVYRGGNKLRLQGKVYQVLLVLIHNQGEVVSREQLKQALWPADTHVNYDANVNTTVNKLRLALGDEPETPQYVETIPRQGYCFVGALERRHEIARAAVPSAAASVEPDLLAESALEAPTAKSLQARLPSFLSSGWAAALLLCGVLIGMGIVLFTHRPL